MRRLFFFSALGVLLLASLSNVRGQTRDGSVQSAAAVQLAASPRLQKIVDDAARSALERFREKGFAEKNLAVTLVDLTDPRRTEQASFRGEEPIYPASVA